MLNNIKINSILFLTGGFVYMFIEYLFRNRSHPLMFVLGGLSLILIGILNERKKLNIWLQMFIGAVIITALELLFGVLFNQNYNIWDYRTIPLNFMGQICPQFSFCWFLLSWVAIKLDDFLRKVVI